MSYRHTTPYLRLRYRVIISVPDQVSSNRYLQTLDEAAYIDFDKKVCRLLFALLIAFSLQQITALGGIVG